MTFVLVLNGEIRDYTFYQPCLGNGVRVVCCDGGLRHAEGLRVTPCAIVGDMDSADEGMVKAYAGQGAAILRFPARKDATDGELALRWALDEGADEILIFGWQGSRFDHVLGNLHLLVLARQAGVSACLVNETNTVRVIDREALLRGRKGDLVSLLPLTQQVTGIWTEGLEYPLRGETLALGPGRGVSNVMAGTHAAVRVESGLLAVVESRD